MSSRFLRGVGATASLAMACGGATSQTGEQERAGAPSTAPQAGGASTAGGVDGGAGAVSTQGGTPPELGGVPSVPGGTSTQAGASAGGPAVIEDQLLCFEPERLPDRWYPDNAGGASNRECITAPETNFSVSVCLYDLTDTALVPAPGDHEGDCCYRGIPGHCR